MSRSHGSKRATSAVTVFDVVLQSLYWLILRYQNNAPTVSGRPLPASDILLDTAFYMLKNTSRDVTIPVLIEPMDFVARLL